MSGINLLNSLAYALSQQQRSGSGTTGGGSRTRQLQKIQFCCATCPDQECQAKLYFPSYEASVECPSCGQRHTVSDLPDKISLSDKDDSFGIELAQIRELYSTAKKPPELVKVKGISNYQCKLLSPLLTEYGMDKSDPPRPKLLKELGLGEVFDCSKFANRVFSIDEAQLNVTGYGLDRSGSQRYLADILTQVRSVNNDVQSLVPLHADGDGHCLVHAISRCLVGRELFWHALRTNLHHHLTSNHNRYKVMFKDFVSEEEWEGIIEEAGPDFSPPDGQSLGLSNIHVYGLANVLRRPILLLDSWSGMQSSGDYSGVFLPTMYSPTECSTKDSSGLLKLNAPIVIAWSSSGHNHFIPLVPVKGKPLPKLPQALCPKVWGPGDDATLLQQYISLDSNGCIELCGGRELGDKYLQKLVGCMETVFREKNNVVTALVADVNQYVYKNAGYASVSLDVVIDCTRSAVEENRLFRCLICRSLSCIPPDWLQKGGNLYEKAAEKFTLQDGIALSFPYDGISAKYDANSDSLVVLEVKCFFCAQDARSLNGDGSIVYLNGDRTSTPAVGSICRCGFKHFWDGKEYDNLPEKVPLTLTWKNISKKIDIYWFQYESDPARNSNVYEVAQKVVNDNFPGEFGSERLVQQVVDSILASTELRENLQQVKGQHPATEALPPPQGMEGVAAGGGGGSSGSSPNKTQESEEEYYLPASKMIATGQKSKTLHKEELNMSETERRIKRNVEENARLQQKKRTAQQQLQQQSHGHSAKTTPQRRENKGSRVSPSPTHKSSTETSPTSSAQSSSSKPASKKIKLTLTDGRSANLTLDPSTTFEQLQLAIEKEFNVPPVNQRLRAGFPPKELKPGADPSVPVQLANGERVQVDVVNIQPKEDEVTLAAEEAKKAIEYLEHFLQGEMDLWAVAQHQPQFFSKGGAYYQQVFDQFGGQVKHNTHIQFKEFHEKVFAFNSEQERLELCLGLQHIPVGPLTPEQEALAKIAFYQSNQQHSSSGEPQISMGLSGAIQRHTSSSHVKAFSGKGHTLSSSSDHTSSSSSSGGGHTLSSSSDGQTLSGSTSGSAFGSGMASGSEALRAGPSGPGRGRGAAGGVVISGGRGRGRFVSGGGSRADGDGGVSGVSRLVEQRRTAVKREDQLQAHDQVGDDPMMAQVQLVAQKKLTSLREKEKELQQEVRALNRKLVEAEANEDGAAVRDDRLTSLETKLLDMSSELKKVREEIAELVTLQ